MVSNNRTYRRPLCGSALSRDRYLRSEEFKNALQTIENRTKELRDSLEREKSSHEGWWNRREQHYAAIAREAARLRRG